LQLEGIYFIPLFGIGFLLLNDLMVKLVLIRARVVGKRADEEVDARDIGF
jgi:hypothetical protein